MKKGDEGDSMYILYHGSVKIFGDPECTQYITTLTPNKVFGETALQNDEKRSASITAYTNCKLLALSKSHYNTIVRVSFYL